MSGFLNRSTEMLRFRREQAAARLCALRRDERGTISLLSVVTIFMLTMVLGMVINAGRNVDEKVRMQSAADAAAYSGGVVVARGLNALAFSNHLEAEIFVLTAYMRVGNATDPAQDPTTLNFENSILDGWNKIGGIFARSSFPKFAALGPAIQQKVPLEKDLVRAFLEMTGLQASLVGPAFEFILRGPSAQPGGSPDPLGGVIPRFQRAIVLTTPQAAQFAASEVARMHGNQMSSGKLSGLEKLHGRQPLTAVLWRTNGTPMSGGNEQDPLQRTLPVIDPSPTGPDMASRTDPASGAYLQLARCQRRRWATNLWLWVWRPYLMDAFYRGIPASGPGGATSAKMSALSWVWDVMMCGQLNKLLEQDYYGTNLPHLYVIQRSGFVNSMMGLTSACQQPNQPGGYDCDCLEGLSALPIVPGYRQLVYENADQSFLEQYQTFVGVVYWPWMQQKSPVYFRYPLAMDAMAFAETSVFVPKARYRCCPWGFWSGTPPQAQWIDNYDNWPEFSNLAVQKRLPLWGLENQNWIAKIVPATSDSVPAILQSSQAQQLAPGVRIPKLGGLSASDLRRINTH